MTHDPATETGSASPPQDRFLSPAQVCQVLGIGRATLWRWLRRPDFPKRRKLGPQKVGFLASEVYAWMRDRPKL